MVFNIDSFVNIVDNNRNVKIISVIGKARTGKSTLLNTIITKINKENTTIFKMSDSGEHCTNGVDYYYIENKGIILLDFQGIYLGDSSLDSKLLLLSYMLSDVIIFNENKMLSNNTLSQFEPMMSFMQYIDDLEKNNPKLIFRISDVNLDIDPTTNMRSMLSHQQDQFQSIRDCINNLFDDPFAVHTNSLDRTEFKLLKNENFLDILFEEENGFNDAVKKICDYIGCCQTEKTIQDFINDTHIMCNSLNKNERIDFNKLDIVMNLANYEILDYINRLDPSIYNEIIVNGSQVVYQNNLLSRISKKEEIIKNIYNRFTTIPKNIIDDQIKKFTDKIDPIIEKAIETNMEMAINRYKEYINEIYEDPIEFQFVYGVTDYDTWFNKIVNLFELVENKIKDLYNVVYDEFINQKNIVLDKINEFYNSELSNINKIKGKYSELAFEYVENIDENIVDLFVEEYKIEPHIKVLKYYNLFFDEKHEELRELILNNEDIKTHTLDLQINIIDIDMSNNMVLKIEKYNTVPLYIKKLIDEYSDILDNIFNEHKNEMIDVMSKKIETLLTEEKSKLNTNKDIHKIISNNPDIIFVKFITHKTYIMTYKYFEQTLKQDLKNISDISNELGYINDWNGFLKEIVHPEIINKTTVNVFTIDFTKYQTEISNDYEKTILFELYLIEYKKYFARKQFSFMF